MIDIKNILICPECMNGLTDELLCEECGNIYSYKYGVYDIISQNMSKLPYAQQMFLKDYDDMFQDETREFSVEYTAVKLYRNEETTEALHKWGISMEGLIENFSGVVCDIATGFGFTLQKLLNSKNKNFDIICTDVDKILLTMTRRIKKTDDSRVYYIVSDARYMSIKDMTVDYITSYGGFGYISESDRVAKELYRILKPGGKIIIYDALSEQGSRSYEMAKKRGPQFRSVDEFITALDNTGFVNTVINVAAEVVCAEDGFPHLAGDKISYCIIIAQRKTI